MKKIKRVTCFALVFVMLFSACIFAGAENAALELTAEGALLMEMSTGEILFQKNETKRLAPASVTKVMTMLLIMEAIEDGKLSYDTVITVSAHAESMGGSNVYLEEGEQMTVHEMLKCIAVSSANDAAVAMGEAISGSEEAFVQKMNERAKELGMENTHFVNCTGLDAEGHYSCAKDIALMSRALLSFSKIKEYTTIWMDTIRNGEFGLSNTNKLVRFYRGTTGLKTGSTDDAKFCISASAERDGTEFIAVVMKAPTSDDRFSDAKKMLNYAFATYEVYHGEKPELSPIPVLKGKQLQVTPEEAVPFSLLVKKGEAKDIEMQVQLAESLSAPVEAGQKVGEVTFVLKEQKIASYPIVVSLGVEKAGVFDIFLRLFHLFLKV